MAVDAHQRAMMRVMELLAELGSLVLETNAALALETTGGEQGRDMPDKSLIPIISPAQPEVKHKNITETEPNHKPNFNKTKIKQTKKEN